MEETDRPHGDIGGGVSADLANTHEEVTTGQRHLGHLVWEWRDCSILPEAVVKLEGFTVLGSAGPSCRTTQGHASLRDGGVSFGAEPRSRLGFGPTSNCKVPPAAMDLKEHPA